MLDADPNAELRTLARLAVNELESLRACGCTRRPDHPTVVDGVLGPGRYSHRKEMRALVKMRVEFALRALRWVLREV